MTAFIIDTDTPGFFVRRVVHTLRATRYATELELVDVRVPHGNVLGEVNGGFAIANERLSRQRIPYAAGCIGPAIVAQQMSIDWAKSRETFGGPLAEEQAIQWMIVDNEIDIRHARWCVLEAAQKADRAIQIHGGIGVTKDLPLERWYRELRIRRIGEGPSAVQRLIMARDILGGSFK